MKKSLFAFGLATALFSASAMAQNFSVTITNLSNGIYFTPLLIAAHAPATHVFQLATAASLNLQAMAEGGDTTGLTADLQAVNADIVNDPAGGFMAPGASATANFNSAAGNTQLSLVAMLLPTNDGFVGLDSLDLPTTPGSYTYYLNAYDAGTEANNEVINGGAAPGVLGVPADPGGNGGTGASGVTTMESNTTVHIHRGNLGDTNPTGGASDLDSRVHRWLNPIARLVVTVN